MLRRLTALIKPHRKRAVLVAALLIAALGVELAQPPIIGRVVNIVEEWLSSGGDVNEAKRGIAFLGSLFLVVSALRSAMMFVSGVQRTRLTQNILWTLRRRLYNAMQRLSFSFFDGAESGQLISRSTTDVQRVARFFEGAFFSSIEALTVLTGVTIYMFYTCPVLAIVALSPMPLTIYVVVRAAKTVRPLYKDARDSYGAVTTALQENIAGTRVVRAFAKEQYEVERFGRTAGDYITRMLRAIDHWAMRVPFAMLIYGLNGPLILIVGGWLVMKGPQAGGIEVGTLFVFLFYLRNMGWRVRMVRRIVNSTARASAGADRIYEILDKEPDVAERRRAVNLPDGPGEVVFENVSFAYYNGTPVLSDINLRVKGGQMVALVGHTGAGKTTLVNLVPRFYDATEGAVKVDGVDVRDLKIANLRRNVALVFQETFLFSASIAENIAYARPGADEEEIVRCAVAAQAHEFVSGLERGYDTVIGERGVTLSGGQRQRVAIARALLANPRILIMDDATASVDSATERQIQEALLELSRGRTTFVIAHRISTVRRSDLIVVLEKGRIEEMGTHKELLALGGIYREICEVQFAEALDEMDTTQ
ncbi:MAG: ABC transporter ATP-binding protein [Planctomycetota bacterium]